MFGIASKSKTTSKFHPIVRFSNLYDGGGAIVVVSCDRDHRVSVLPCPAVHHLFHTHIGWQQGAGSLANLFHEGLP